MTAKLATKPVTDELETIKQGIHLAMDCLINRKDYPEAERILRQVDHRLVLLINQTQVAS